MADPLISADALKGRSRARLVDATWFLGTTGRDARAEYEREHLPGAVWFDIDAISDRTTSLPHMLPKPQAFERAAGQLGLSERDEIVVYDRENLAGAARAWWTLRVFGAGDVRVLDGGLKAWKAAGGRVEPGNVWAGERRFNARFRPELVKGLDDVQRALAARGQVLDARPAARFRGEAPEPRAGLRGGHMPGALNLPFVELLRADGTMLAADELRARFEAAGVDVERPVTASCGSGITACVLALGLARIGREDAAVYDGSWTEWGGRADTPVVTGA